MKKITRVGGIIALASILGACSTIATTVSPAPLGVVLAPVVFDGNVAGRATEYVFILVPNDNPAVPGIALGKDETLSIKMPTAFRRNPAMAMQAENDSNMVMTKGWPQGAIKLAGQYSNAFSADGNVLTIKSIQAIGTDGANAPGIKMIHLRGQTFFNPGAGSYPVMVEQRAADGRTAAVWEGTIKVVDEPPTALLAPSNFHLAPGQNANYQRIATSTMVPAPLGLLLWDANGKPLNHVGITPRDLTRFPRYTGGLLVQDSNGDKLLDPAVDTVVGGIIGEAPAEAHGQLASSPLGADGKPILSGDALRHPAFPPAANGGKPNPGLLLVAFRSGDRAGAYRPTFELIGGNSFRYTIDAVSP